MAAIARLGVRKNRNRPMSKILSTPASSVAAGKVPAPVRVRLKRVNCDQAIPYPRDGQTREWWHRLKNAFGTASSAFVGASLPNCSGTAAEQRNFRDCCERQLGLHRGRQAPG